MAPNFPERYRTSMFQHRYGYALYEPPSVSRLCPGMLGYLDEYRKWHPILDLSSAIDVEELGYSPIGQLYRSEPDECRWGPLASDNVKSTDIAFSGKIDPTNLALPANATGAIEYRSNTDFGALLICDSPVSSEGYDFRRPFLEWLRLNSNKLLHDYPDLKKYGAYIATWTYSATDIHMKLWSDSATRVNIGFSVEATSVVKADQRLKWLRSHSGKGWRDWSGKQRVVFFTGVKVRYGPFGMMKQSEGRWRGSNQDFIVTGLDEGKSCEASVEQFGDDWAKIKGD
ncbi:hypothetical protein N7471_013128 [Penicillium samsonianum]|uniref:uncharacterized protein n=1 Tax=Penicillium samsonianum TaxID=1882272 RepID=UPI002548AA38|nr:uncharacterized protein N7471_013128 [Penicillium samsonianum]KAJ6118508.1 hypothetical protein N7471_013128 [Penicillium samsonianum]